MASTINASNGAVPGLISTGDNSGELQLQTNNGVTAVTIDASQNVAVVGNLTFNNGQSAVSTGKAIAMAIVFGG